MRHRDPRDDPVRPHVDPVYRVRNIEAATIENPEVVLVGGKRAWPSVDADSNSLIAR
jgi:hypothetical protein